MAGNPFGFSKKPTPAVEVPFVADPLGARGAVPEKRPWELPRAGAQVEMKGVDVEKRMFFSFNRVLGQGVYFSVVLYIDS